MSEKIEDRDVSDSVLVEVVGSHGMEPPLWNPVAGTAVQRVLRHYRDAVSPHGREVVLREALGVLSNCAPPRDSAGNRTGLIIGHVQSGKTLSFTTVSALAHDNRFPLIITISGSTTNLFKQSNERLRDALGTGGHGPWRFYSTKELGVQHVPALETALETWEPDYPFPSRRTILISAMKEKSHLNTLIRVLDRLDLAGVPSLIIDDEADYASLNTQYGKGKESATHRRVRRIRSALPLHTYLQYTATPQAILLLKTLDVLAPDFATVLTPGEDYTGGREFFDDGQQLIRAIPDIDLPGEVAEDPEPPASLLSAMRVYFVGATAARIVEEWPQRSMMVHPSTRQEVHALYRFWVENVKERWSDELDDLCNGRCVGGEAEEIEAAWKQAYDDVAMTVDELPDFDEVLTKVRFLIRETVVTELNNRGPESGEPNFERDLFNIVVGGLKLDRGFTVEGLTVSYMPRGLGVGNADSIQQRARWFGYKAEYLGFCRVYLTEDMRRAYREYVEHERVLRGEIRGLLRRGTPLGEWRRAFLLNRSLQPTRRSVIQYELTRGRLTDWVYVRAPQLGPCLEENRSLAAAFTASRQFVPDEGSPERSPSQCHVVSHGSLRDVYDEFLTCIRVADPYDSAVMTGLLLQLSTVVDAEPNWPVAVFQMRPGVSDYTRSLDSRGHIKQLFQGPAPDASGSIYPGDRKIWGGVDCITVQIHTLDRLLDPSGQVVAERVVVPAIRVPQKLAKDWLVGVEPEEAE